MKRKDKIYIAGSVLSLAIAGFLIFYEVRANKSDDADKSAALQNNPAQVASDQIAANQQQDMNQPDNNNNNTAIPDPANNSAASSDSAASQNTGGAGTSSGASASSDHPHGPWQNLPAGSKPFFGTISAISDNQITITSRNNTSAAVTILDSTEFDGGTKDQLTSGTRIAGYGTANSDGTIAAVKLMVNPSMPSGGRFNRSEANQPQQ